MVSTFDVFLSMPTCILCLLALHLLIQAPLVAGCERICFVCHSCEYGSVASSMLSDEEIELQCQHSYLTRYVISITCAPGRYMLGVSSTCAQP
jgi:hypothetical protein